MPANKFLNTLLLPWLCLALLTACGQKGPLYLPEQGPPAAKTEAQEPAQPGEPVTDAAASPAAEPLAAPAKVDDDESPRH